MSLLSLIAGVVFAAETILSPIPDNLPVTAPAPAQPDISFGQIINVLGETTQVVPTETPTPTPTPTPLLTQKKSYTIAFLGDSMTDTLGPGFPALQTRLRTLYSNTTFTLVNFGLGGTNLDAAISRIPSVAAAHPDIVVLESSGYNPFPIPDGVTYHWMALAKAVDTLRAAIPGVKIVIAATIAPNSGVFGDGAPGISFGPQDKIERTDVIKAYLDSTVKFAKSQHLPLADAYHASLDSAGNGKLVYINGGDHIHYSDAGRILFAGKVAAALQTVL